MNNTIIIDVLFLFEESKDILNLRCLSKDLNEIIICNLDKQYFRNIEFKIKQDLSEKDFITFVTKFKPVNLNLNRNDNITDKAFKNLKGIHTLDMSNCDQDTITDKAFEHLKGIHTLNVRWCNQKKNH